MKKNRKFGYLNNIVLFVISIIITIILIMVLKPDTKSYMVCRDISRSSCVFGYTGWYYKYIPGETHDMLIKIFSIFFLVSIISSIIISLLKKEKKIIILNIIFAIINAVFIYFIPMNMIRADKKYGNEIQVPDSILENFKPDPQVISN